MHLAVGALHHLWHAVKVRHAYDTVQRCIQSQTQDFHGWVLPACHGRWRLQRQSALVVAGRGLGSREDSSTTWELEDKIATASVQDDAMNPSLLQFLCDWFLCARYLRAPPLHCDWASCFAPCWYLWEGTFAIWGSSFLLSPVVRGMLDVDGVHGVSSRRRAYLHRLGLLLCAAAGAMLAPLLHAIFKAGRASKSARQHTRHLPTIEPDVVARS
jgi:hypothetical protein